MFPVGTAYASRVGVHQSDSGVREGRGTQPSGTTRARPVFRPILSPGESAPDLLSASDRSGARLAGRSRRYPRWTQPGRIPEATVPHGGVFASPEPTPPNACLPCWAPASPKARELGKVDQAEMALSRSSEFETTSLATNHSPLWCTWWFQRARSSFEPLGDL